MTQIYSKYNNMHKNKINYRLKCSNNHIITCENEAMHVLIDLKRRLEFSYICKGLRSKEEVSLSSSKI